MNTYKVKRSKDKHLVIDGFITSRDLDVLKKKLMRKGYNVASGECDLPIRNWIEVTLNDYDYR